MLAVEMIYVVANITAVEFLARLSDVETEGTTLSISYMDCVTECLGREFDGITSNEQKWFEIEL